MLQQGLHIIILSLICISWGIPVVLIFSNSIKKDEFWYHSRSGLLGFLFFCGCIVLSALSSWIYLFAPLKFPLLALLTGLLVVYLLLFHREKIRQLFLGTPARGKNSSMVTYGFIIVTVFLFLLLSALQPANGDTQIYHLQIVQWQFEYKAIPGIANLYPRFGLGSDWFNLISFFYWPSFKNENFTYLNAAFVIWFFLWLFSKWRFYSQQPDSRFLSLFYLLMLLYGLFDWQVFRDAANSTNYDFAVNAFTVIVVSFFLEAIFTNKIRNRFSLLILLFILCAVSFKLSGIFLGVILIYHFLSSWRSINWPIAIFFGFMLVFPVLLKNYVITGYPLFPSLFAVNHPDWMLPKKLAAGFYDYIILSNRFYNHQWTLINQVKHTAFNWIPYWFSGILLKHKIILALSLCSIFFLFRKPNLDISHKQLRGLIICLLLMLMGWFFTAPDPGRFGYGILLSSCFLTVSFLMHKLIKARWDAAILLISIVLVLAYTGKKGKPVLDHPQTLISPIGFQQPAYQLISVRDFNLNWPEKVDANWDCRCYFTPLPCVTQKNPYLQARGTEIKDGFRMNPSPDSSYISTYLY